MAKRDYYEVLGVNKSASAEQIKSADFICSAEALLFTPKTS